MSLSLHHKKIKMKRNKIIFWISTGILSLMMLFSASQYLLNPQMAAAFTHMGFPSFFRIELAVAKIIGAIVLLIPGLPTKLKDWSFAGFGIVFVSAFIAHLSNGDGVAMVISPIVFLAILIISYRTYHKTMVIA